jgi:hypothetical protein
MTEPLEERSAVKLRRTFKYKYFKIEKQGAILGCKEQENMLDYLWSTTYKIH